MGLFFTIVTLGLASRLPSHLYKGLVAAGVAPGAARIVANEPPIGSLFSAFLGYNNGDGASRRSWREGNGVNAAAASSAETELGASAENG